MIRKLLFAVSLFSAVIVMAEEAAVIIGDKHEVFSKSKDQFIPDGEKGLFVWRSEAKRTACYSAENSQAILTLFEKRVHSALVRFENDKPSAITFTLCNRKDRQSMSYDNFMKEIKTVYNSLKQRYPKVKPKYLKRQQGNLKVNAIIWVSDKYICFMKWGIMVTPKNEKNPEYFQVEFLTFDPAKGLPKRSIGPTVYAVVKDKAEQVSKTEQEDNGDVFLKEFPMFVQPEKGNSAAAVVQRILEYKGKKITKPLEAKPLKKGTKLFSDVDELPLQLDEVCTKNNLKLKTEFVLFYKDRSLRKLENLVGRYNRAVKKGKKDKLTAPKSGKAPVTVLIKKMEPDTFLKLRNEEHGALVFEGSVIQNITSGQPLIWYVMTGIVKEDNLPKNVQPLHMRLIIGFNSTTKTVIYTDCAGKGHEIKRMPFDKAWPITLGTYTVTPKE